MDLSTRAAKRLRLDDFLKQNLVEAPARNLIEWVDSRQGIFRILWTHQSSGDFNTGDAALFRYWAIARGKSPDGLSSVDLKQSLRMALNKSPSVQRLPSIHDDRNYRHFRVKSHILSDWWKEYPDELEKFCSGEHSLAILNSPDDTTAHSIPTSNSSPSFDHSQYEEKYLTSSPRFIGASSRSIPPPSYRDRDQLFRPYELGGMDDSAISMGTQDPEPLLLPHERYRPQQEDSNKFSSLEIDSRNLYADSQSYLLPDGGYYSSSGSSPGSSSPDDMSRIKFPSSHSYVLPEGPEYSSPGSSPGSSEGVPKTKRECPSSLSFALSGTMEYPNGAALKGASGTDEVTRWGLPSDKPTNIDRCEWVPPQLTSPNDDLTNSSLYKKNLDRCEWVPPPLTSPSDDLMNSSLYKKNLDRCEWVPPPLASPSDDLMNSSLYKKNLDRCEWVPPHLTSPSDDLTSSSLYKKDRRLQKKPRAKHPSRDAAELHPFNGFSNASHFPDDGFITWSRESLAIEDTQDLLIGRTNLEPACLWSQGY